MKINSISLTHFRNFDSFHLNFDQDINIFIGKNAQGKTNLIESFYVLSLCRSFRTHITKQMIQFDQPFAKIQGTIQSNHHHLDLEVILNDQNKRAKVNGNDIMKTSEFVGYLNVVVFTPDDLSLVKGGPGQRRRFIDLELSKVSPIYLFNLSKYNRLLKERNKFLKLMKERNTKSDPYLEVLNEQLAALQVDIIKKRLNFINQLTALSEVVYQKIANNHEHIRFKYKSFIALDFDTLYEAILKRYERNIERDIRYTMTQDGIHKDDMKIFINDHDAFDYASQGQQRTIVLAIKIALLELIRNEIGEYPVLLLDDVLSELDDSRKGMLLNLLDQKIQTFITTTSLDDIDQKILKNASVFVIEEGKLKEE